MWDVAPTALLSVQCIDLQRHAGEHAIGSCLLCLLQRMACRAEPLLLFKGKSTCPVFNSTAAWLRAGLAWGQEGWRRMTWSKVRHVNAVGSRFLACCFLLESHGRQPGRWQAWFSLLMHCDCLTTEECCSLLPYKSFSWTLWSTGCFNWVVYFDTTPCLSLPQPMLPRCRSFSWTLWSTGASTGWCRTQMWCGSETPRRSWPSIPWQVRFQVAEAM